MTAAQKTPQDRKPKADAGHPFTVKGKSYRLPPLSETGAMSVPGEVTFAAVMNPGDEFAQMRLAIANLEAAKPTPAAMAALKSLPTGEMLKVVMEWLGEQQGSSD